MHIYLYMLVSVALRPARPSLPRSPYIHNTSSEHGACLTAGVLAVEDNVFRTTKKHRHCFVARFDGDLRTKTAVWPFHGELCDYQLTYGQWNISRQQRG